MGWMLGTLPACMASQWLAMEPWGSIIGMARCAPGAAAHLLADELGSAGPLPQVQQGAHGQGEAKQGGRHVVLEARHVLHKLRSNRGRAAGQARVPWAGSSRRGSSRPGLLRAHLHPHLAPMLVQHCRAGMGGAEFCTEEMAVCAALAKCVQRLCTHSKPRTDLVDVDVQPAVGKAPGLEDAYDVLPALPNHLCGKRRASGGAVHGSRGVNQPAC